jgi:wyosine [tRNA(Phe)-imidazoG37] synthetase (radical SAM superfamily)
MSNELAHVLPKRTSPNHATSGFGCPRQFYENRFVYSVISSRARGLSIGVNMNPDKYCNFNCEYCEVDRTTPAWEKSLDVDVMADELEQMLKLAFTGELKNIAPYTHTPDELLQLRQVALSGDGEPTLCPNFLDAVRSVVHVRARGGFPFFKIVLITNATGFDLRGVQDGLKMFTPTDEIWAKLDAGTERDIEAVNHPGCPLDKILENILLVSRLRPIVIQGLFPRLNHQDPTPEMIEAYGLRLRELKRAGAQIPLVQIYSSTRPVTNTSCEHLPLRTLSAIAQRVHEISGLETEVF